MAMRKIVLVGWIDKHFLWKLDRGYKLLVNNFERFKQNHFKDKEQRTVLMDQIFEKEKPNHIKVRVTFEIKD
jgi:hypothetical protein